MIIEGYAILGGGSFVESCKNELRSIFHFTLVSPDPSQREPRMTPILMRPIEAMFIVPSSIHPISRFLLQEYTDVCIHAIRVCASKMETFQGRFSAFEEKDISTGWTIYINEYKFEIFPSILYILTSNILPFTCSDLSFIDLSVAIERSRYSFITSVISVEFCWYQ